jgi:hypothetical protein
MTKNNNDNSDAWIDGARIKMYEDIQRLGQEEWHRQIGERVQKIADEYGFTIVDRIPSTHISEELKQRMQETSVMASKVV